MPPALIPQDPQGCPGTGRRAVPTSALLWLVFAALLLEPVLGQLEQRGGLRTGSWAGRAQPSVQPPQLPGFGTVGAGRGHLATCGQCKQGCCILPWELSLPGCLSSLGRAEGTACH